MVNVQSSIHKERRKNNNQFSMLNQCFNVIIFNPEMERKKVMKRQRNNIYY